MPTGYTAIIEEKPDLTFREFALRCARAMGACVMQRDEGNDSLPRVDPPSDYHLKAKEKAEARLYELRSLTKESVRALFDAEVAAIKKRNEESVARAVEKEKLYKRMRRMVEAWTPPTAQHDGLRKFMLQQIDSCDSDWKPYTYEPPADPVKWHEEQIDGAYRDVGYHAEHHAQEISRYAERKDWIERLYGSVGA
jgi:hypothetical protein